MSITGDFQLWLAKSNHLINVTPITGPISWGSSTEELGQRLDFEIAYSDARYIPKNPIEIGDMVILKNGKNEILRTFVVAEDRTGREPYKYVSFDGAFYLNKSKRIYQFNGMKGDAAIRKILKDFNVPVGEIVSIPTTIDEIYANETPADIIRDILDQAEKDQGIKYRMEMRVGKLYIVKQQDLLITGRFRLASNLGYRDITRSISNPSRSRSIEDMKNSVQIVQDNRVIATIRDENLINKYGLLMDVVEVQNKDVAQAKNIAKNILKDFGRVLEENKLEMLGDDRVRAGRLIQIDEPVTGMKGKYLIKSVTHTVSNGIHRMSLDLEVV